MIVYGSTLSPYVRKVMVFGAEKGLDLTLEPAGMGQGGPEFERASPFRKMPGFLDPDEDFAISDSTAIITYLDAKHPEPNLIPTEAKARARTIWFEEFADTLVMAAGGKIFFNRFVKPKVLKQECDEAVAGAAERDELPPLIDYLESVVPESGFLVEDRLTLADIAIASPFVNFRHVGVDIDGTRWPKATAYLDRILARPSYATLVEQEQRMVAALG